MFRQFFIYKIIHIKEQLKVSEDSNFEQNHLVGFKIFRSTKKLQEESGTSGLLIQTNFLTVLPGYVYLRF